MFELNLSNSYLAPYLQRARSERAKTAAGILRASAIAVRKGITALVAARARRRLRRETVRQLRSLPDRILRDIGIPHSQIWTVANDLVGGTVPKAAPQRLAANQNRPNSRPHLAVPAVAGCG